MLPIRTHFYVNSAPAELNLPPSGQTSPICFSMTNNTCFFPLPTSLGNPVKSSNHFAAFQSTKSDFQSSKSDFQSTESVFQSTKLVFQSTEPKNPAFSRSKHSIFSEIHSTDREIHSTDQEIHSTDLNTNPRIEKSIPRSAKSIPTTAKSNPPTKKSNPPTKIPSQEVRNPIQEVRFALHRPGNAFLKINSKIQEEGNSFHWIIFPSQLYRLKILNQNAPMCWICNPTPNQNNQLITLK